MVNTPTNNQMVPKNMYYADWYIVKGVIFILIIIIGVFLFLEFIDYIPLLTGEEKDLKYKEERKREREIERERKRKERFQSLENFVDLYKKDKESFNENNNVNQEEDLPEDLYIPGAANQYSDLEAKEVDNGIMREINSNVLFSQEDELSNEQMIIILNKMKNMSFKFKFKNEDGIDDKDYNKLLFTRIKYEIITIINQLIIKNKFYNQYHEYKFLKIINTRLLNKKQVFNIKQNKFYLLIGKENAYQLFRIYFKISISNQSGNFTINIDNSELIGIELPEDITIKNNKTESNITSENILGTNNTYLNPSYSKFDDKFKRFDIPETLFQKQYQTLEMERYRKHLAEDKYKRDHKCFAFLNNESIELERYQNKKTCTSFHPEVDQNGIWDAPCQIDTDCPFYQANKNYENNFGGCDDDSGYCQMPLGLKRIGYKKYDKSKPLCYNCPTKEEDCCLKQYNDIQDGNSKLLSPDLAFINDKAARLKQKDILSEKGLQVDPPL